MYNLNNKVSFDVELAREFQIQSVEDAKVFLSDVAQFGAVHVPDVDNPGFHFIVSKDGRKDSVAVVGYEPDNKHWSLAVDMYGGERAVEMIFNGRRSINAYLKSACH